MNTASAVFATAIGGNAIVFFLIWASAVVGKWTARIANRNWAGWLVGLAVAAGIFIAAMPLLHAIKVIQCRADDYPTACMDGD